tara:strand:- start:264 stop:455 length:192 start_codon:yes stop_codon:yes gene_type:complete
LAAKKVNDAVPTIAKEIGRVDRELIGDILNPIIELKKTVTGGAVNEKTWQTISIIKFLFFNIS